MTPHTEHTPAGGPQPPRTLAEAWGLARADLLRRLQLQGRPATRREMLRAVLHRGGCAVLLFRLLDLAHARGQRVVLRLGHLLLYYLGRVEIHPGARIGPGLVLPDVGGVGIPAFCQIGRNCTFTGPALLTIGGMEGIDLATDRILMGDDCVIGANARLLGAISLADGTQVAPGSVVMTSFNKPGLMLSGIPARRRATLAPELLAGWSPLQGRGLGRNEEERKMEVQGFRQTLALFREDVAFRCAYEKKPLTRGVYLKLLLNPSGLAVLLFRFHAYFASHGLSLLGGLLGYLNLVLFSVAIDPRAKIGGGLVLIHAHSIYISARTTIGRNCILFHQNSIGYSPFASDAPSDAGPVLGDNVIVGAGAAIYGPVQVGSGSKIAVNSTVDCDCPDNSVMFGVPARQVAKA